MASVQTKDYIVQLIKEEILSGGICGTSSKPSYPGSSFERTADS